jgi:hypothetical protein
MDDRAREWDATFAARVYVLAWHFMLWNNKEIK